MFFVMPRKRKNDLPPLDLSDSPFGERLATYRKQKGLSQSELADMVGITQPLLSDYERGRLQLSAEMAVRFAIALNVSCNDLLGLKPPKMDDPSAPPRRLLKRMEKIQKLPAHDQRTLLRTIDGFLRGA